jgi:hypothetical protein
MEKFKNKPKKETDHWQVGLLAAKANIPKNYMPLFVHYFPELNTPELKNKIRQVINLRSYDANIVSKIQKLSEILKSKTNGNK